MTWLARPRTEPYTAQGIRRVKCVRCSSPAVHQWQVCADDNHYRALCLACDVELNKMVLEWARDPNAASKVAAYAVRQEQVQ